MAISGVSLATVVGGGVGGGGETVDREGEVQPRFFQGGLISHRSFVSTVLPIAGLAIFGVFALVKRGSNPAQIRDWLVRELDRIDRLWLKGHRANAMERLLTDIENAVLTAEDRVSGIALRDSAKELRSELVARSEGYLRFGSGASPYPIFGIADQDVGAFRFVVDEDVRKLVAAGHFGRFRRLQMMLRGPGMTLERRS